MKRTVAYMKQTVEPADGASFDSGVKYCLELMTNVGVLTADKVVQKEALAQRDLSEVEREVWIELHNCIHTEERRSIRDWGSNTHFHRSGLSVVERVG